MPTLWMAQSEEDARRLVAMGARAEAVRVGGNLKIDVRAVGENRVAALIKEAAAGRPVIVAGSTGDDFDGNPWETELCIRAWLGKVAGDLRALLVVAPRHPDRFDQVEGMATPYRYVRASDWSNTHRKVYGIEGTPDFRHSVEDLEIVVLDTIGDLAAVYGVADIAFVGGSLVRGGGHNPLEPAQFGVPVIMGPSYENFRDIVERLKAADAIRILGKWDELEPIFVEMLRNREAAKAMGERGRRVFEEQQGVTGRAVVAIVELLGVKG
jgi:3-deoxy-D-manno-octulosonic-acid transferase